MTTLPPLAAAYVRAVNGHDRAAFIDCFSADAVVNDAGREFRGVDEIRAWSDREIMDAQVTLDVSGMADSGSELIITTKVDGNFDRTGLPDPLHIDHHITAQRDKIVRLTCLLAGEKRYA